MNFFDFLGGHYGAFVGYFVGGVLAIVTSTIFMKEVCFRRYGVDICPGAAGSLTRARQRRQILQDQRAAREIAQQEERSIRREDVVQRRSERRAKYEVFLKPTYCMTVDEADFYRDTGSSQGVSCAPKQDIETGSFPSSDDTSTSSNSHVDPAEESMHAPPRVGLATEEHLQLTLPVTTVDGKPRRVEASCSICLMEYEVGESVIWSTRKACPHAFHDECILSWLAKGKKRCPCCRNFFVPGQSIDDKKFIIDNCTEETINEESDGNNEQDESIIEEIRRSAHATANDGASSPPRRRSSYEPRTHPPLSPLDPEAAVIESSNTL